MTVTASRATDSLLRTAIRVDAVVIAAVGVAVVAAAGPLSRVTGMPVGVEYAVGVLSIAYGPLGFWLASRPRVRTAGLVIAEINLVSAVGLVAVVLAGLAPLGTVAAELALALAGYTAVIGVVQYLGVRRCSA